MKTKSPTTTIDPYLNYDDDFIYSDPFGTGHKNNDDYLTDDYQEMVETYTLIIDILKQSYDISAFISLFVNLPHLLILTRKELRSNLVYIFMIGICLSDLTHAIGKISQIVLKWKVGYWKEVCIGAYPYYHVMIDIFAKCSQIMSRRCSGFLALFLAAFRAFSVLFPMNNAVNFLMKAKSGYLIVLMIMLVCGVWSSLYRFKTIVLKLTMYISFGFLFVVRVKKFRCPIGITPSWVMYRQDTTGEAELSLRVFDGYIALVVCILYLLVAGTLVITLYKANKRRKSLRSDKSNNTSTLVIAMAVLMFLSETAYGALFIVSSSVFLDFKERTLFEQLEVGAMTLSIVNSIAHCFICFAMSSQYRDVVKGLLCIRKKEKVHFKKAISVGESSARPTSVETIKTTKSLKRSF